MKSANSGPVMAIGLAATLLFGLGLATFVTQSVVAESQDDDDERNGGFDLKDWCVTADQGDVWTIKAEGVTLRVDVSNARGNRRPIAGPSGTATGTPSTTDGPVGHLARIRGAVDNGVWDANNVNLKRQGCDLVTGEPLDGPVLTGTPGTAQPTRTARPTRTPREERTPGRPDENPGRGRGPN